MLFKYGIHPRFQAVDFCTSEVFYVTPSTSRRCPMHQEESHIRYLRGNDMRGGLFQFQFFFPESAYPWPKGTVRAVEPCIHIRHRVSNVVFRGILVSTWFVYCTVCSFSFDIFCLYKVDEPRQEPVIGFRQWYVMCPSIFNFSILYQRLKSAVSVSLLIGDWSHLNGQELPTILSR